MKRRFDDYDDYEKDDYRNKKTRKDRVKESLKYKERSEDSNNDREDER